MRTNPKRHAMTTVLICSGIALGGCYLGDSPLSASQPGSVDSRLNGEWRCIASSEESPVRLTITTGGADRHDIRLGVPGEYEDEYVAHITRLDEVDIANVQEMDDGLPTNEWVYLKYTLLGEDVLDLRIVSENAMAGVPSDEALDVIRSRSADPDLYEHFCTCVLTMS